MAGLSLGSLLPLAFSAGLATFFAPCAFPLLPGYLSYFLGEAATSGRSGAPSSQATAAADATAGTTTDTAASTTTDSAAGTTANSAGSATANSPRSATRNSAAGTSTSGGTERSTATDTEGVTPASTPTADATLIERVRQPTARALVIGGVASLGMVLVYVLLAGTAVVLGASALSDVAVFELVVGSVFVVGGLAMAAGWKPSGTLVQLPERRRSLGGIFLFGVLYAVAAAGCTAPLFLAVVLQGASVGPLAGATVAVSYALGMGSVMLVVAGLSVAGSSLIGRIGRHAGRLYRVAGGLLVLSGVAEIYYYLEGFPAVIPT